jgi:hypothetical protein
MSATTNTTAITENTIRPIWSAHGLGPVTHIERPRGGVRNLCFFVNDAFVVRFNTQDHGSAKFHSERLAYEVLAQQSIPDVCILMSCFCNWKKR